jgi:hypothetical protein
MTAARALFFIAALAMAAGCGSRVHLTESYARSYRLAFARQVVNPTADRPAAPGLDSQEAAAVVAGYRAQLAPRGSRAEDQTMLLLAPQAAGAAGGLMPAPSVPSGR